MRKAHRKLYITLEKQLGIKNSLSRERETKRQDKGNKKADREREY